MVTKEVSATATMEDGSKVPVTVSVPWYETMEEANADGVSEEAILSNAFANFRVTLQSSLRARIKQGKSQDKIQEEFSTAKIGVAMQKAKVDPMDVVLNKIKNGTEEERKALLDMLLAAAEG